MTTTTWNVVADGDHLELTTYPTGRAAYTCADDYESSAYLWAQYLPPVTYLADTFKVLPHAISMGQISSVYVCGGVLMGTPSYVSGKAVISINGVLYYGTALNTTGSMLQMTWTTSPATGQAWTWSELIDCQIGLALRTTSPSYPTRGITLPGDYCYITITYTEIPSVCGGAAGPYGVF